MFYDDIIYPFVHFIIYLSRTHCHSLILYLSCTCSLLPYLLFTYDQLIISLASTSHILIIYLFTYHWPPYQSLIMSLLSTLHPLLFVLSSTYSWPIIDKDHFLIIQGIRIRHTLHHFKAWHCTADESSSRFAALDIRSMHQKSIQLEVTMDLGGLPMVNDGE